MRRANHKRGATPCVLRLSTCCLVLAVCVSRPATVHAITFSLTDIGDLPGGEDYSDARGLNNLGHVAGVSYVEPEGGNSRYRGYFWSPDTGMVSIGALATSTAAYSEGVAVNDLGQVTGVAQTATVQSNVILWDAQNGIQDLGFQGTGYGINNAGQIVGSLGGVTNTAFLWDIANGVQTLSNLGGNALAINDIGQIIGQTVLLDPDGTVHHLSSVPGALGPPSAFGLNDIGQVVGSIQVYPGTGSYPNTGRRAFVWSEITGITPFPDLPGQNVDTHAFDINDAGLIVGDSNHVGGDRAMLWSPCGAADLNDLLDASGAGWTLQFATAINDNGQIVGYGMSPNGKQHAFLLTPHFTLGDVNHDVCVNVFDVNLVSAHWGESGPTGDANADGIVDIFDVNAISANWTSTGAGGATAVPEPSTIALALVAAVGWLAMSRKHRIALK